MALPPTAAARRGIQPVIKAIIELAEVAAPVAVRYAWSDNPICNAFSAEGLPVTPFRTDDFPMITDPANPNGIEGQAAKRQEEIKATLKKRQEELKKAKIQQTKSAKPKKAA